MAIRYWRHGVPGLRGKQGHKENTRAAVCGRGLAREEPECATLDQDARVIVDDDREQALSHI